MRADDLDADGLALTCHAHRRDRSGEIADNGGAGPDKHIHIGALHAVHLQHALVPVRLVVMLKRGAHQNGREHHVIALEEFVPLPAHLRLHFLPYGPFGKGECAANCLQGGMALVVCGEGLLQFRPVIANALRHARADLRVEQDEIAFRDFGEGERGACVPVHICARVLQRLGGICQKAHAFLVDVAERVFDPDSNAKLFRALCAGGRQGEFPARCIVPVRPGGER